MVVSEKNEDSLFLSNSKEFSSEKQRNEDGTEVKLQPWIRNCLRFKRLPNSSGRAVM